MAIVVPYDVDIEKLQSKLKDVETSMGKVGNAAKKSSKSVETGLKRQKGLIEDTEDAIKELEKARKKAQDVKTITRYNQKIKEAQFDLNKLKTAGTEAFKKVGKEIDQAGKKTNTFTSTLKKGVALLGIGIGIAAIRSLAKASIKAFDEQQKAEKRLLVALGGRKDIQEDLLIQAKEFQDTTIFADEDVIAAQSLIAAFTDEKETIEELTRVTLDFATAKGFELPAAAELVSKTFASSTNSLTRYGIQVEGVAGSSERLESITKNLDTAFGGQAAAAVTGAGKLQQLGNKLDDVKERFGGFLVEAILPLTDGLDSFVDALLESNKTTADLAQETINANKTLEAQEEELNKLLPRYDELQSKSELNKDEQEELGDIVKKVAEIVPEATTSFDKYGEALDINTTAARENFKAQKSIAEIKNADVIFEVRQQILKNNEAFIRNNEILKAGVDFTFRQVSEFKQLKVETELTTEAARKYGDQNRTLEEDTRVLLDRLQGLGGTLTEGQQRFLEFGSAIEDVDIEDAINGLIDAQKELLKQAKLLPEATEAELVVKNQRIKLINEEIKRLKELGVQDEKTRTEELSAAISELNKELQDQALSGEISSDTLGEFTDKTNELKAAQELLKKAIEGTTFAFEDAPGFIGITEEEINREIKAQEEINKRKLQAILENENLSVDAKEAALRKELELTLNTLDLTKSERILVEQEIQDKIDEIKDKGAQDDEGRRRETRDAAIQGAADLAGSISTIANNSRQKQINLIQRQANDELEILQDQLDAKEISEEDFAEREKEINEDVDKATRELQRKQAITDKAAAIFGATIAGILAVVKSLPNIPLSIIVGVLSTANVAAIASTPIPDFHKGEVDIQGKGDEFPAILKRRESVMTVEETARHKDQLTAMRKKTWDKYVLDNYYLPALQQARDEQQRSFAENVAQSIIIQQAGMNDVNLLHSLKMLRKSGSKDADRIIKSMKGYGRDLRSI